MSNTGNLKTFYGFMLKSKLNAKDERLAKAREHQRRERKEELYSYRLKSRNTNS